VEVGRRRAAARRRRRPAPRGAALPTRAALGDAVARLREADWPLRQVTDHGTHLAIYISDPDGNDLELAWDRPFAEWPRDEAGHAAMAMDGEIDLDALIAESRSG
jgi:catechol 2,3-dioxygenase